MSIKRNPCSVESTSRQVIEHKLLTALEDGKTVAILATQNDLLTLLAALENYEGPSDWRQRCLDLASGMRQLLREAFPPGHPNSDLADSNCLNRYDADPTNIRAD